MTISPAVLLAAVITLIPATGFSQEPVPPDSVLEVGDQLRVRMRGTSWVNASVGRMGPCIAILRLVEDDNAPLPRGSYQRLALSDITALERLQRRSANAAGDTVRVWRALPRDLIANRYASCRPGGSARASPRGRRVFVWQFYRDRRPETYTGIPKL